ncbi:MAG: CHAT domain-containing protein [Crocinitomicaceae bacterium]|nr:CHAT domain-containing protein [Crocinitomicaceae bacterium]
MIVLVSSSVYSQIKIDSLVQVWENQFLPDTVRSKAVYKIIWDGYMYSNLDSANYYSRKAIDFASEKKLRKEEGEFYNALGTTYYLGSDNINAELNYLTSLSIMEEIQFQKGIASALTNLGTVNSANSNHAKALEYLYRGLLIRESLNDLVGAAIAINNIGNIHRREERFDEAIDCHQRALAIYTDKANKRGISNSMLNLGLDYMDLSNFEMALFYFNQCLAIQIEIKYVAGQILTLTNLGTVYTSLANYPKAIEYHNQCAALSLETNNVSGLANAYNNLGIVFFYQGNYQKALKSYEDALQIRRSTNSITGVTSSLTNIGIIYKRLHRYDDALKCYFEARTLALEKNILPVIVTSLNNIAAVYFQKWELETALDYLNQSLSLQTNEGNLPVKSSTLVSIASIYFELSRTDEALAFCQEALSIAQLVNAEREVNTALALLVKLFMNQKKYNDAETISAEIMESNRKFLEMNFAIMTEGEQEEYVKTIKGDFDVKFSIALDRKDANPSLCGSAFNDAIYLKGILLKSSTATRNAILSSGDSILIEKYQEWIILKRQITKKSGANQSTLLLEQRADSLERYLVQSSQALSEFKNLQNQSWLDVKSSLKKNQAAIEIIQFEKKSFAPADTGKQIVYCALIVTQNSEFPEMIELFNESELINLIGSLPSNNLNFIEGLYGKKSEAKRALYDIIWKPMEEELDGIKTIYISPSGLLHKISFASLSRENDVFLCDQFQFQNVTSTAKIISPDQFGFDANSTTTIFGGIEYNTDSTAREVWSYLEGTKTETETIDQILENKNYPVNYLTNLSATESEFKNRASGSSVLHIATHGFFFPDPEQSSQQDQLVIVEDVTDFRGSARGYTDYLENKNPMMRSGLVFAGANNVWSTETSKEDDGVLTAEEVVDIDMRNTQLVVLSACETGLGDIKGSEGVYGLQRAFKMAGVKFIIMSLWQVPDKETSEFMTLFYKRLIKLKDLQKAFAQTQKIMRTKYDPYYWAAFVLIN